jgi:peroxiredoxin
VHVIGVAWSGSDDEMQSFVDRHGLRFPSANDEGGDIFARFRVPTQPAWVFIDGAGAVTTHLGAMESDELSATFGTLSGST